MIRAVRDARRCRVLLRCWSHKRLAPESRGPSASILDVRCCKARKSCEALNNRVDGLLQPRRPAVGGEESL